MSTAPTDEGPDLTGISGKVILEGVEVERGLVKVLKEHHGAEDIVHP